MIILKLDELLWFNVGILHAVNEMVMQVYQILTLNSDNYARLPNIPSSLNKSWRPTLYEQLMPSKYYQMKDRKYQTDVYMTNAGELKKCRHIQMPFI
jgi:hypothetical protein